MQDVPTKDVGSPHFHHGGTFASRLPPRRVWVATGLIIGLLVLPSLKTDVDEKELRRISNKFELQRLKIAQSNDEILTCMQDRVLHGRSSSDFQVKSITAADIKAAARRFLPSYKGAYVRLAMVGQ
jgi:hypothetical protein